MLRKKMKCAQISLSFILLLGATQSINSDNLTTDISPSKIKTIHKFYTDEKNRVKIQFPIKQNRYVWQNFCRFYPTAQILRDGDIYKFPKKIDKSIGEIKALVKGKKLTLNQHLDRYPVDAFLVVKHGEIVYERYNTMRTIDKHNWFSNSKIATGTLVLMLVNEGKIKLDDKISKYLPKLKGSAWDSVSVLDTLDMATGLDATEHDEPHHDSRTNPKQGWYRWAAALDIVQADTKESPLQVVAQMKRRYKGHTKFEYNSINTFVLSRLVEAVEDKPINEVFSQRIWQKMGASSDAYAVVSKKEGYPLFFFSINSTLEDMARFGMLFTPSAAKLPYGKVIDKRVVSMIQKSGDPKIYAKGFAGKKFLKSFYNDKVIKNGFQWDAIFSDGDFFKSGVGGQGIYISPSKDLVIVWFSTGDGSNQEESYAREIAKNI